MIHRDRVRIRDIHASPPLDQEVTVWGWVRTTRVSRGVAFVQLNDGSSLTTLQLVLDRDQSGLPEPKSITTGSCVRATGTVVESQGKGQAIELRVSALDIIGPADETYPLQKKGHSLEFLRTIANLRTRSNTFQASFRLRSELSLAMHEYFHERGFAYVHPPLITRSDCEGAGQAFRVTSLDLDAVRQKGEALDDAHDYFGSPAFLTVSGQLHGEALALGLGEIYTFSPIFRADPSETARHTAEFWMVEPEMAFYDFEDLIALIEDFIRAITRRVKERCSAELAFFERFFEPELPARYQSLLEQPFERIDYTDAIDLLSKEAHRFEFPPKWGEDLATEHERFLTDEVFKRLVFVTNYPKSFKPFYMRLNDDDRTVACLDLLAPQVGELLTGSQREERLDVLEGRAQELGLHRPDYEWYLQTRRWGSAPHAGFGIGLERMHMALSGMKNIRDVLPFPRTRGSI